MAQGGYTSEVLVEMDVAMFSAAVPEPMMTEPLPTLDPKDFKLKSIPAAVEWLGADGRLRHMYQQDPSRQVTFEVLYTAAEGAALFKLKAPVGIEAIAGNKTPLFLYIPGDRISSLVWNVPDIVPDFVTETLGADPSRLQLSLSRPADMVVPFVSLAPRHNKRDGNMIDSLKLIAQETRLSIYLARSSLSDAMLQPLCDAIASRTLKPIDMASNLVTLYRGSGYKVLEGAELCIPVPPTLPSYDQLEPMPPQAPLHTAPIPTKKRCRSSDSSAENRADTTFIDKKTADMGAQFRKMKRRLLKMRVSWRDVLVKLRTEIREEIGRRWSDRRGVMFTREDVEYYISKQLENVTSELEGSVDNKLTELEESVDAKLTELEESTKGNFAFELAEKKRELDAQFEGMVAVAATEVLRRVQAGICRVSMEDEEFDPDL